VSRLGRIGPLPFADGDYEFALNWGELILLQEAVDAGPFAILQRLSSGEWRIEHISHVIRLGLIGAGTKPEKALQLVRSYVEARPPADSLPLAQGILFAGVQGAPDEPVGDAPGEAEAPETESA
jgi:hypothetical protein